jgi:tripartite-type tricarboxylate transporter receptor subunit TctC
MPTRRRRAIAALACSFALFAGPGWSQSSYPAKPVRIVVPFPPGQAADTFSRMLVERLSALWGQQVVVENRGGGGGLDQ